LMAFAARLLGHEELRPWFKSRVKISISDV
jgi:hypothetical protein